MMYIHQYIQSLVTVDHIYPIELEIKDPTDTTRSVLLIDMLLEIDIRGGGSWEQNFPLISSNIPELVFLSWFPWYL